MPPSQQWARVRAHTTCPLRRGAWYPVLELTPLDAVLEVNEQRLSVPRAFLQILPVRPPLWSVVTRREGPATGPGDAASRYAVCPRCSARAPLEESSRSMPCAGCGAVFKIAWSDSYWRVFEVPSGGLRARVLARAWEVALRLRLVGSGGG
jgi:hypothetical protein